MKSTEAFWEELLPEQTSQRLIALPSMPCMLPFKLANACESNIGPHIAHRRLAWWMHVKTCHALFRRRNAVRSSHVASNLSAWRHRSASSKCSSEWRLHLSRRFYIWISHSLPRKKSRGLCLRKQSEDIYTHASGSAMLCSEAEKVRMHHWRRQHLRDTIWLRTQNMVFDAGADIAARTRTRRAKNADQVLLYKLFWPLFTCTSSFPARCALKAMNSIRQKQLPACHSDAERYGHRMTYLSRFWQRWASVLTNAFGHEGKPEPHSCKPARLQRPILSWLQAPHTIRFEQSNVTAQVAETSCTSRHEGVVCLSMHHAYEIVRLLRLRVDCHDQTHLFLHDFWFAKAICSMGAPVAPHQQYFEKSQNVQD